MSILLGTTAERTAIARTNQEFIDLEGIRRVQLLPFARAKTM
jgi:hypothetical protein